MTTLELLKRRIERRMREHARAWERYTFNARNMAHQDVLWEFRCKADVAAARVDECRLILNQLKANGQGK